MPLQSKHNALFSYELVALFGKTTMKCIDNMNKGNRHLQPLNHLVNISAKLEDLGDHAGVTFQ